MIVESKPGAGGTIAAVAVARPAPDGHTTLLSSSSLLSTTILQPAAGCKTPDLAPVRLLVLTPIAIGVCSAPAVNTIQQWVVLAKKAPGSLSYGTCGQGSGGHFVGGQVDAVIASLGGASRHPGKIKALAIASPTRFPIDNDVPTFAEIGLPAVNMPGWGGVFLPAATPKPVVAKLSAEPQRVIMLPGGRRRCCTWASNWSAEARIPCRPSWSSNR